MVIEEEDRDPLKESVRIDKALHRMLMPVDVLVISAGKLAELADKPGLIYREILQTGRVVCDADQGASAGGET